MQPTDPKNPNNNVPAAPVAAVPGAASAPAPAAGPEVPGATPAAAPVGAPAPVLPMNGTPGPASGIGSPQAITANPAAASGGHKKMIIISVVVLVILLAIVGGVVYFLSMSGSKDANTADQANGGQTTPATSAAQLLEETKAVDLGDGSSDLKEVDTDLNNL